MNAILIHAETLKGLYNGLAWIRKSSYLLCSWLVVWNFCFKCK